MSTHYCHRKQEGTEGSYEHQQRNETEETDHNNNPQTHEGKGRTTGKKNKTKQTRTNFERKKKPHKDRTEEP